MARHAGPGQHRIYAYLQGESSAPYAKATASAWHAIQTVFNGANAVMNIDGVDGATANTGSGALVPSSGIAIGSGGTLSASGQLIEIGYWPIAFSSAQRTALCHNEYVR